MMKFLMRSPRYLAALGQFAFVGLWLTTGCALFHSEPTPPFADIPIEPPHRSVTDGNVGGTAGTQERNVLAIDDQVIVSFSGLTPENLPQQHEERIKDDGNITLPIVGAVKAKDKTIGDLQREILALYVPKYYNSNLTVTVKTQERVFFVQGQVRTPGRIVYSGVITVTKAISSAGDFTDFANKKSVKLIRADGRIFMVNCIKALENPALDLQVFPGDQIIVKQRIF